MATGFYLLDNAQPITQQYGYPRRGAVLSGTCIVHTAECALDNVGDDTSAEGTANFIRTRSDYGSYHTLVDSDSIIEMVPYEYETWQDSQTNPWAVGISAAAQADGWHLIPADRKDRYYRNLAWAAADFVKYMATKGVTVPVKRITGAQARARVPGFCAHGDSGVDRHDPGVQFEWDKFLKYTNEALKGTTVTPSGTTTPKEDTLSAAEVKEIKTAIAAEGKKNREYVAALLINGYTIGGVKKPSLLEVAANTQGRVTNGNAETLNLLKAVGVRAGLTAEDLAKIDKVMEQNLEEGRLKVEFIQPNLEEK